MQINIKHKGISWIHLKSPNAKEVEEATRPFSVHPLIKEELTSPSVRAKADIYQNHFYLILHFPSYNPVTQATVASEVDFVVGEKFIITSQYGELGPLEEMVKECGRKSESRETYFNGNAFILMYKIIKKLYDFSLRELDHITVKINEVEEQIFNDREKEMIKKISVLKKDIIDFRRIIYPHQAILVSLEKNQENLFGKEFKHYLNDLLGEFVKINNLTENSRETIDALYQTNVSLLSTKSNEIMKILTILAFITFPLMLLSSIFGMNTQYTPVIGTKADFWIIIAVMSLATLGMFFFFKRKKWL
jgi:magnesium transporter